MQIKRFEAKNMTTALRLIKGELGPEAVILSARSLRKGTGFFGSLKYSGVEVTAAIDTGEMERNSAGRPGSKSTLAAPKNGQFRHAGPFTDRDKAVSDRMLSKEQTHAGPRPRQKMPAAGNHRALSILYQQILAQGVDRAIASELIDEIKRIPAFQDLVAGGDLNAQICTILEDMGVLSDKTALSRGEPKMVALIGGTGTGKTTAIAKLAAVQTHQRQKQVAVISIDNYGIAANEQLKAYARIIGFSLACAVNAAELRRAINTFKDQDLILIDTPGINPNEPDQIRELNAYFAKLPELQKYLVVSAATKEKDLVAYGRTIKEFGIRRMVFTKLDESSTHGNLLNVLVRTNLPLAYVCRGRTVPHDIEAGSIPNLVDLIFQFNARDPKSSTAASTSANAAAKEIQNPVVDRAYFVANKNSDVYHETDCKWSGKIKTGNIIQFWSTQEAEKQNFLPCRSCNPDRPKNHDTRDARSAARSFSNFR